MNQTIPIADAVDPVEEASMGSFPASDPPPWWKGTPARIVPGRTVLEFRGANCAWCLNDVLNGLRSQDAVVTATLHAETGCIEVIHEARDVGDVLSAIRADLRGWHQADNGERVMVRVPLHPSPNCRSGHRGDQPQA